MRIHIDDLRPTLSVTISGEEPWLSRIYGDFPAPDAGPPPKLTGRVDLRREEAGSVHVTGKVDFAPQVGCGRCGREIAWPLDLVVDARFLPEATNETPKEKNLSRAELDAYYLESYEVDLEGLLNDVVQTALPLKPVPASDDGKECRVCKADLTTEHVYGPADEPEAPASPFAVLKGLKLKN